ncbi:hypothetical protein BT96DRAFT_943169 [Gymnopus androsaceus JB14]|uniref:Uncharacterized protein n=1 Tax=Gymnopus androsaceus JB14 TaxID=1447944 RepID=A0A6A4HB12_9AGAR|nr:hypothetical protein BT96DRAFT_943169 [Gymnopus androsaceus JB14]
MALATRLNELAAANEQGLLDDDEYRLLRQDVFERFAAGDTGAGKVLVEPKPSTAPTTTATSVVQPKPRKLTRRPSEGTINSTNNASSSGNNHSIASFIRRATSPLGSIRIRSSSRPGSSSSRKNSDAGLAGRSVPVPDPHLLSPPTSPTRPVHTKSPSSNNSTSKVKSKSTAPSPLSAHDIFEDGGLFTPADIRRAIAELDDDARRLVTAFEELEESAVRKETVRAREASHGRSMNLSGRNQSVLSLSSPPPPTIQHRSKSDNPAAVTAVSSNSKGINTRLRSKSTTSLRDQARSAAITGPNNPYPTPPPSSHPITQTTPALRKKSSVSLPRLIPIFLEIQTIYTFPAITAFSQL